MRESAKAMEAQIEAETGAAGPQDEQQETLLAGKFNTQEDLEQGYLELQKKLSEWTPATETTEDGPAFQIKKEGDAQADQASGFNADKYKAEFMENGKLSDESRKEIIAQGIPEEMIATHEAGLQAIRDSRADTIRGIFGSEDRMESILKWASNNLGDAEIQAIESQANSLDMTVCEAAIKGLVARYDASPMGQGNALEGVPGGPAVAAFRSEAERNEAHNVRMSDGRFKYDVDAAYRADVDAKTLSMV